jgi:hypothetical protein
VGADSSWLRFGLEGSGLTTACGSGNTPRVRLAEPAQFLPKAGAHQLTLSKTIQIELLIGRMGIVIRQGETEHEGVRMENVFELIDDRDGATFAHQYGFVIKGLFKGAESCQRARTRGGNQIGLGAMSGLDFQAHGRRTQSF